jgi:hypothetical protein
VTIGGVKKCPKLFNVIYGRPQTPFPSFFVYLKTFRTGRQNSIPKSGQKFMLVWLRSKSYFNRMLLWKKQAKQTTFLVFAGLIKYFSGPHLARESNVARFKTYLHTSSLKLQLLTQVFLCTYSYVQLFFLGMLSLY